MSVDTAIEATPTTELEHALAMGQAASKEAVAADKVWAAADAARHAAWSRLQLIESSLALELRGATAPAEIARITFALEAVERSVDLVFRPRDESWPALSDRDGQSHASVTA